MSLSKKELLELDDLCGQFELEWSPNSGLVESYLSRASDRQRSFLVKELVALECELLTRSGHESSCTDLRSRMPDWSVEIDDACRDCPLANGGVCDTKPGHPERFGDYRILREIGRGGAGIVYEAEQGSLGRRVAIKVMTAFGLLIPEAVERFQRESRAVAAMHHSNIVQIYGTGEQDGMHYYAMQFVDGESLDRVISELKDGKTSNRGLISVPESDQSPSTMGSQWSAIAKIGVQVADALSYAHSRGILHRDIKPANLLLQGNMVWVTDFGLAKLHQEEGNATRTGDIVGTLRYLPPEAVRGTWDERGDVYGLGLTLYELLTLRPAFHERDRTVLLQRVTNGEPPKSLRQIDGSIPRDVDTVVMKAIARDPQDRYQTADDFGHDLQNLLDGQPILARRFSIPERLWKWSQRKPNLAALIATVTLVAVIGFPTMASLWLRAKGAKQIAEMERDNSDAVSYASSMQLAQSFIEQGNPNEARALLNAWSSERIRDRGSGNAQRFDWEWDYLNSRVNSSIRTLTGLPGPTYSIAVRSDGLQFATAGTQAVEGVGAHQSRQIRLWDAETGQTKFTLEGQADGVTSLAYSPDGQWLAAIGRNKRIMIWESETGELLQDLAAPEIDAKKVHPTAAVFSPVVSFSSDGRWLCSSSNPLVIRDTETWEVAWQVKGLVGGFVPGADQLIARVGEVGTIYDLNSTVPIQRNESMGAVIEMSFSADGKRLCTWARAKGFRIWKLPSLELEQEIIASDVYWNSLSPDGKLLVHADQSGVMWVRQIDKNEPPSIFMGHDGMLRHGAYHAVTNKLFTVGDDATVREWNPHQVSWKSTIKTKITNDSLGDLAFGPDGKKVLCVSRWDPADDAGKLSQLDLEQGTYDTLPLSLTTRAKWPRTDFAFSHDEKWLAVPAVEDKHPGQKFIIGDAESRRVNLYSSPTARLVNTLELPANGISSVAWSRDDTLIAVAGYSAGNSTISIFELDESVTDDEIDLNADRTTIAKGTLPRSTWRVGDSRISAISFNATGALLAASTDTGTHIWDLQTQQGPTQTRTLAHDGVVSGESASFLDWSKDDCLAASYRTASVVRVYDVANGHLKYEINAPRNPTCVRFSPNGNRLAIVGYDSLVHLCDAVRGRRVLTLKGSNTHAGRTSMTARVLFSKDGNRIATNDHQGRITVWDSGAGTPPTSQRPKSTH